MKPMMRILSVVAGVWLMVGTVAAEDLPFCGWGHSRCKQLPLCGKAEGGICKASIVHGFYQKPDEWNYYRARHREGDHWCFLIVDLLEHEPMRLNDYGDGKCKNGWVTGRLRVGIEGGSMTGMTYQGQWTGIVTIRLEGGERQRIRYSKGVRKE